MFGRKQELELAEGFRPVKFFFFRLSKCKNDEMNTNNIDLDDPKYYFTKDFQFNSTKTDSLNMKTMGNPNFPLVKSQSQDSFESEANVDLADYTEPEKVYENQDNYYKTVISP